MLKKFTCTALAVSIMISGMICVSATSKAAFSLENAKEYFTLMNGCSRTALKNYNDEDTVDAIVSVSYTHLDVYKRQVFNSILNQIFKHKLHKFFVCKNFLVICSYDNIFT